MGGGEGKERCSKMKMGWDEYEMIDWEKGKENEINV